MQKFTYDTSVSAANFTLILQTESAMPEHQLPVTLEEIPEEEMARYPVRRTKGVKTFVRTKPGGVLMPATYAHLAKRFYNLELRSDDVVVAAYPKSGTVWTAEVVWALLNPHALDTLEAKPHHHRATLLDMDFLHPTRAEDNSPLLQRFLSECPRGRLEDGMTLQLAAVAPSPRILKTHLPINLLNPDMLNICKVVYVARNPRDVCVSLYRFLGMMKGVTVPVEFRAFVESFMSASLHYGPYWDHLEQAWRQREHPNLHVVFYEDMKKDVLEELRKLSTFLGRSLEDDQLRSIVEYTSFGRMKARDAKFPVVDLNGSFFRKGEIGDWKNMASPQLDALMNGWIKEKSRGMDITFKYE